MGLYKNTYVIIVLPERVRRTHLFESMASIEIRNFINVCDVKLMQKAATENACQCDVISEEIIVHFAT
jgi:hypothetical protein